ncbi:hypothetical protein FB382_004379 [Nocardioides ginsengisegetis]|uniref:Uncharacterized protein n=1 Tax=Nocardioides ginsengisegetis TaxID=661491 RepID=A0A7W3J484_9ACTN|nr:hypothetical protein [Nocardioides ginsengisegetis]
MIVRDDLPETPEWTLPARETEQPTIPENITLSDN